MILFELRCPADHRFEAWFKDGAAYEFQVARNVINCPVCGDSAIAKAPMAPRIARAHGEAPPVRHQQAELVRQLGALRRKVEESCDYVGERFAEEARRIHYGETDARDIYGEATETQTEELKEEGVAFSRVPWLPRTDS